MQLTSVQQREIARMANWKLDCYLGRNTADSVVLAGEGVGDLDRTIAFLQSKAVQPGARFLIELAQGQYSDWRPFDLEDLQAIRSQFVAIHGNVDRPVTWEIDHSTALQLHA